MPSVQQIVENGTNNDKIALVDRAKAVFVEENIGFMWAVLNYRDQVNNPGAVAPVPIAVTQIGGVVTGANLSAAEMGLQIYNRFINRNAEKQVNLAYDNSQWLLNISQQVGTPFTPGDFEAAYTEIAMLMLNQIPSLGT